MFAHTISQPIDRCGCSDTTSVWLTSIKTFAFNFNGSTSQMARYPHPLFQQKTLFFKVFTKIHLKTIRMDLNEVVKV